MEWEGRPNHFFHSVPCYSREKYTSNRRSKKPGRISVATLQYLYTGCGKMYLPMWKLLCFFECAHISPWNKCLLIHKNLLKAFNYPHISHALCRPSTPILNSSWLCSSNLLQIWLTHNWCVLRQHRFQHWHKAKTKNL